MIHPRPHIRRRRRVQKPRVLTDKFIMDQFIDLKRSLQELQELSDRPAPDEIVVRRVMVMNDAGELVGVMSSDDHGNGYVLARPADGKCLAVLSADHDGGRVMLSNPSGGAHTMLTPRHD